MLYIILGVDLEQMGVGEGKHAQFNFLHSEVVRTTCSCNYIFLFILDWYVLERDTEVFQSYLNNSMSGIPWHFCFHLKFLKESSASYYFMPFSSVLICKLVIALICTRYKPYADTPAPIWNPPEASVAPHRCIGQSIQY